MKGRIPQAAIDEVLERTSLVELIDSHVPLIKKGRNYTACCPFHHEKTPSFNVIPDKQFYYCFGCGVSGNAISFLMEYLKKDFVSAVEELAVQAGIAVRKQDDPAHKVNRGAFNLLDNVCSYYQQQLSASAEAKQYLSQRGISQKTIAHFRLGFAPQGWQNVLKCFPKQQADLLETGMLIQNDQGRIYDRYRKRIMFPIANRKGDIIGFGGRVISPDEKPKYLNSPETSYFHKSKELYGLHYVQTLAPSNVLIVEGYMDVIALFEHGIENVVATLGTSTSAQHIQRLLKVSNSLVFCFDGDNAGKQAARRALEQCLPYVTDGVNFSFMFIAEGEDPDSLIRQLGKEGFIAEIEKAQTFDDFLFQTLQSEATLPGNAGKSQLVELAKPLLQRMPESAFKALILRRLSLLTRLDNTRLDKLIQNDSQPPTQRQAPKQAAQRPKLSAMRTALALLVQQPALYSQLPHELDHSLLIKSGNAILGELLQILPQKQTAAQVLEHWRDKEAFSVIAKLAALPLAIPDEGKLAELEGALVQIQKNSLQAEIDELLYKANTKVLTHEDKRHLQQLILKKKAILNNRVKDY